MYIYIFKITHSFMRARSFSRCTLACILCEWKKIAVDSASLYIISSFLISLIFVPLRKVTQPSQISRAHSGHFLLPPSRSSFYFPGDFSRSRVLPPRLGFLRAKGDANQPLSFHQSFLPANDDPMQWRECGIVWSGGKDVHFPFRPSLNCVLVETIRPCPTIRATFNAAARSPEIW